MKYIEIFSLAQTDYHITSIFAMHQSWKNNYVFWAMAHTRRPTSALLYINECKAVYKLADGKTFTAKKGDIVYIPQGAMYETVFIDTSPEKTSSMLIEFSALDTDNVPFVFFRDITLIKDYNDIYKNYFLEIINLFISPIRPISMIKSILYRFLSEICHTHRAKNIYSNEFSSIAEGILYLENNNTYDKSIDEIARMCHVSPSGFRRLFREYSGMSPKQYVMNVKISQSKMLLRSNSMNIREVSDKLNFSSPAYFCRCFKNHTGMTPMEYLKCM